MSEVHIALLLAEFNKAWRDDTPVYACCKKAVRAFLENIDYDHAMSLEHAQRYTYASQLIEKQLPKHLETHRCCVGHVANACFDLSLMREKEAVTS